jgi:hypothetical protein
MHSHRVNTILAAGAFMTAGFASAVAVGAAPRDHHITPERAAVAASTHPHAKNGRAISQVAVAHHRSSATTAGTPGPLPTHARSGAAASGHHSIVVTTPTAPQVAVRTTPAPSAVAAAIRGLGTYVHSILAPTLAQVAQFGNLVCTAYADGSATKAIEVEILHKVSSIPLTTILTGAADYVVRTAVTLYCPGYSSQLGAAGA